MLTFIKLNYPGVKVSSTRFPNVIFSRGSISESILENTLNQKKFEIPNNIKRYFITENEAASIIILTLNDDFDGYISFPKKNLFGNSINIKDLCVRIRKVLNKKTKFIKNYLKKNSEKNKSADENNSIYLTKTTKGEKSIEIFFNKNEQQENTKNIYIKKVPLPKIKNIEKDILLLLSNKKKIDKNMILKMIKKEEKIKNFKKEKNLFQVI